MEWEIYKASISIILQFYGRRLVWVMRISQNNFLLENWITLKAYAPEILHGLWLVNSLRHLLVVLLLVCAWFYLQYLIKHILWIISFKIVISNGRLKLSMKIFSFFFFLVVSPGKMISVQLQSE